MKRFNKKCDLFKYQHALLPPLVLSVPASRFFYPTLSSCPSLIFYPSLPHKLSLYPSFPHILSFPPSCTILISIHPSYSILPCLIHYLISILPSYSILPSLMHYLYIHPSLIFHPSLQRGGLDM